MENLAMKELERGHYCVSQLQRLMTLKSHNGGDDEVLTMSYAQDLCAMVDDSLRNAIFLLDYEDSPANADESYQTSKSRSHTIKDPTRFSPQKRKSIQTWEDNSEIGPKEDGYAWRKYGQKFILNAKHPSFDENHNETIMTKPPLEQKSNCKKQSVNDYVPSSLTSNDCLLSLSSEVLPFQSDDLMDVISSPKIWRSTVRISSN